MRVSEMMTLEPVVVPGQTSLPTAAARMVHLRIRHLPVVGEDGLLGVLTDSLVFRRGAFLGEPGPGSRPAEFVAYEEADESLTAADLAAPAAVTCAPDDALEPVVRAIARSPQDYAIVLDEHRQPVGILTEHDCTRLALATLPRDVTVDHLEGRPLVSFRIGTSAGQVLAALEREHIRHAVIVDPSGSIAGVVSQRDLVMDDVKRRAAVLVDDVVRSRVVFSVPLGTSLYTCAEEMLAQGVGSLPLVRGERPVGIVTRRDLVEAVANALQAEGLFD